MDPIRPKHDTHDNNIEVGKLTDDEVGEGKDDAAEEAEEQGEEEEPEEDEEIGKRSQGECQ